MTLDELIARIQATTTLEELTRLSYDYEAELYACALSNPKQVESALNEKMQAFGVK